MQFPQQVISSFFLLIWTDGAFTLNLVLKWLIFWSHRDILRLNKDIPEVGTK